MRANFQNGEQDYFDMKSGQRVDRYSIYADQKHRLTRNWELGYGASFQFVRDKDFQNLQSGRRRYLYSKYEL